MKNLLLKLHKLQSEVGTIKKDSTNPFFRSKYFDINSLIDAIKPILTKHGLVILQPLIELNGKIALKTIIADSESGELLETVTPITSTEDPQKNGSSITYYRRYALQSLLMLEAEDDDGESAKRSSYYADSGIRYANQQRESAGISTDPNEPPPIDYEAQEIANQMGGEVVPNFPDCPHPNLKGSKYRKCYSCNLKK